VTSARHLFCYDLHRDAVEAFLHEVGSSASHSHLRVIKYAKDLVGYDHITFIEVKDPPIPQWLWKKLHICGATVIELTPGSHRLTATHFK